MWYALLQNILHIKNGEENQQIATLQVIDIYKVTGIMLIQLSST